MNWDKLGFTDQTENVVGYCAEEQGRTEGRTDHFHQEITFFLIVFQLSFNTVSPDLTDARPAAWLRLRWAVPALCSAMWRDTKPNLCAFHPHTPPCP